MERPSFTSETMAMREVIVVRDWMNWIVCKYFYILLVYIIYRAEVPKGTNQVAFTYCFNVVK